MVSKLPIVLLLATVAASPALGMQGKGKKKHSAARPAARIEFTLPVSGLTKENAGAVQKALGELAMSGFLCPGCGSAQDAAGECEACGKALEERSQALFKNVTASAGKGTIAFRLTPRVHVRLSQIEKALGGTSVRIQREKSDLGKKATLVYEGGASADDAADLEKAFHAADVPEAAAALDPTSKEIQVRIPQGSLGWKAAARLGESHAAKLRLTDVIWGPLGAAKKG